MNLAIVFLLKNKRRKLVTWEINKGNDTTKEDLRFPARSLQLVRTMEITPCYSIQ